MYKEISIRSFFIRDVQNVEIYNTVCLDKLIKNMCGYCEQALAKLTFFFFKLILMFLPHY